MRVLVYGAGVLGCELAHELAMRGNAVTMLARGAWRRTIDQDGLVIRHSLQRRTTVDRVRTIEKLDGDDIYDLIFVVMQCNQIPEVLSAVAANHSRFVVLVGNNGEALATCELLQACSSKVQEVAFGFQGSAGHREANRVVSLHVGAGMTVGGADAPLSTAFSEALERAFSQKNYRLTRNDGMDAWLKCHLALILPVCYVCYAVDGRLPRATRAQRKAVLDAAQEGCAVVRAAGVSVDPEEDAYYRPGAKRMVMAALLFVMAKTPIGRLAASDHAMHALDEIWLLDEQFSALRARAEKRGKPMPMPAWDSLKASRSSWEKLVREVRGA